MVIGYDCDPPVEVSTAAGFLVEVECFRNRKIVGAEGFADDFRAAVGPVAMPTPRMPRMPRSRSRLHDAMSMSRWATRKPVMMAMVTKTRKADKDEESNEANAKEEEYAAAKGGGATACTWARVVVRVRVVVVSEVISWEFVLSIAGLKEAGFFVNVIHGGFGHSGFSFGEKRGLLFVCAGGINSRAPRARSTRGRKLRHACIRSSI